MKLKLLTNIFILFTIPLLLSANNSAKIKVYSQIVNPVKTSNLINGGFIEFLNDFVNGPTGMWAQEIFDRGFEEVYRQRQEYYHWKRYFADNDTIAHKNNVEIIYGGYNRSDSNQLRITNATEVESGIYQSIQLNDEISHTCYIYVHTENANGIAKIVLFDTLNQQRIYEKVLSIDTSISNSGWLKIEFEIPAIPNHYSYNFAITYKGSGNVYFDEVSLMPTNNIYGVRKEWVDILRDMKCGILRYPGGFFVEMPEIRWKDGIGDIDQRRSDAKRMSEYHNHYSQRVDFGTDEYMKICELLDIEPYIVTNITLPASDAADQVQYCNGDTNTYWGKMRAANGHPEPYNVKMWEIGNEQYIYSTVEDFADKFLKFNAAMKEIDSTIKTIFSVAYWGSDNYLDKILPTIGNYADIVGYHLCEGRPKSSIVDDEKLFLSIMSSIDDGFINNESRRIKNYPNLTLSATEWWISYSTTIDECVVDTNIRNFTLEPALWSAKIYLMMMRNPQIVTLAAKTLGLGSITHGINSSGEKVIFATPAISAIALCNAHRGDYIIKNTLKCDTYAIYEEHNWANPTPYLDVTTSISDDTLFIAVINRNVYDAITTEIEIDYKTIHQNGKSYEFTSNHFLDRNTADEPNKIATVEKPLVLGGSTFSYSFPKHSLTILAIPGFFNSIPSQSDKFIISPNPFNNSLYAIFDDAKQVNYIRVYDMLGNIVYETPYYFYSNFIVINNLNLSKGAYRLSIDTNEGEYSSSIIKE
ncbi:MAG: T9SS type A sorting domain-containing protein [Ignavibacteria bacterium]|jgi:alpha-N-arabinofuranosidase|nr:T9SS type A sorting domain-containing protein [Ignavibacteria bacterium]